MKIRVPRPIAISYNPRNGIRLRGEDDGYALVALLALMAILMLMTIAIAPNLRQQALREREIEAINRGEEVAEAIRLYILEKRTLPTSMEQLTEGLPRGSKKLQILRPAAAIDPLSESGEWKLIRPNSAAMIEFQKQVMTYNNDKLPGTRDETRVPEVYGRVIPRIAGVINTKSEDSASSSSSEDDAANTSGPFIGVASRNRSDSVIHYYGIDRHDEWIFTPLFRE
jgi:type II secretory pathway pseudopilin PulG